MGLFSRTPARTDPAGAARYLIRHDNHPFIQAYRKEPDTLAAAAEGWDNLTREERLGELEFCFRHLLTFGTDGVAESRLFSPEGQHITRYAEVKSRVLEVLWNATYGETVMDVGASWEPFSEEEIRLWDPRGIHVSDPPAADA